MNKLFVAIAAYITGFWKNDLEPWLLDFGHEVEHDVVTQLIPYAAEAFAEVGGIIGSSGSAEEKATAAGQVLTLTLNKAANAAINATLHDAATALASVSASITKGATAANQAVVAQVASVPAAGDVAGTAQTAA